MNAGSQVEANMGLSGRDTEGEADHRGLVSSVVVISVAVVAGLFLSNQAALLRVAIPVMAGAVGMVLYLYRPVRYLSFTLWVWFLTPLVRRLVDWRFGFTDPNEILLAPFVVSMIASLTPFRRLQGVDLRKIQPFLLCMVGILYGLLVGVVRIVLHTGEATPLSGTILALLGWLTPVIFGLHLYLNSSRYEANRAAVEKSFLWAVLLLGIYGIYQYMVAPAWDCVWLESLPAGLDMITFGQPAPFQIRVWSAMNAPAAFAEMMVAGLLLVFGMQVRYKLVFLAPGFAALLLSMVRLAWLDWLLGMVLLTMNLRGVALRRALLSLVILPICFLPVLLIPQMSQTVEERLSTLGNPRSDESVHDRLAMYKNLPEILFHVPAGLGLNYINSYKGYTVDSGLVALVMMQGLFGSAMFLLGIGKAVAGSLRNKDAGPSHLEQQQTVYRTVVLVFIAGALGGNTFTNVIGVLFWVCIGLMLSAQLRQTENAAPFKFWSVRDRMLRHI